MVPRWHRYRAAGLAWLFAGSAFAQSPPAIGPVEGSTSVRIIAPIQYTLPPIGGLPTISQVRKPVGPLSPPPVSFGLSEPAREVGRTSSPGLRTGYIPQPGAPNVHTWMLPPKPSPGPILESLPQYQPVRRDPVPVQQNPGMMPELLPPTRLVPISRGAMPTTEADEGAIPKPVESGASGSRKATVPPVRVPPMLELLSPTRLNPPPYFGTSPSGTPRASREPPTVLPINLATALTLAGVRPIDVQIAARQTEIAAAAYLRANAQWLPSISVGGDYLRHEGAFQIFSGAISQASRNSAMIGVGLNAVFSASDAVFGPLSARQDVRARQAFAQAAGNDVALQVTDAYFQIQQARADYLVAEELVRRGQEMVRRIEALAEGLAPPADASRARVESSRRRQAEIAALERWQTASAELNRLLRLEPGILLVAAELPGMTVSVLADPGRVDELIVAALLNRPELEGHRAVVEATLARLRQEKLRPLLPSVLLRSASTNPSGSLGYGAFGGGQGGRTGDFKARFDYDAQIIWELQNLGIGNLARIRERKAETQVAMLELFRVQDRVASEVNQAHARLISATDRMALSESAVRDAMETFDASLEGMRQTRRVGNFLTLIVRPAETVAALQGLAQTTVEYQQTVADYNRAQFALARAIGNPPRNLVAGLDPPTESGAADDAPCLAKPPGIE